MDRLLEVFAWIWGDERPVMGDIGELCCVEYVRG
jgi:hypothetical protein